MSLAEFGSMLLTFKKCDTVKMTWNCPKRYVTNGKPMYHNNNYGAISHRSGDMAMYRLKIAEFTCPLNLTPPLGAANDTGVILVWRCMWGLSTLSVCQVSFRTLAGLCSTLVDAEEEIKDDEETTRDISTSLLSTTVTAQHTVTPDLNPGSLLCYSTNLPLGHPTPNRFNLAYFWQICAHSTGTFSLQTPQ